MKAKKNSNTKRAGVAVDATVRIYDFINKYRQKIRNLIVYLEAKSVKWAYPDYECTQMVDDINYYRNKLVDIRGLLKRSHNDRFLRDEEMFCENRIWEIETVLPSISSANPSDHQSPRTAGAGDAGATNKASEE